MPLKAKKWEISPNLKIGKKLVFSKVHILELPLCNFQVIFEGDCLEMASSSEHGLPLCPLASVAFYKGLVNGIDSPERFKK